MTRKELLRSMLKSIFNVITLSLDGDKISKGANNSFYHNCNYTVGSYNDFKRLFKIVFISDAPKDLDDTDFNRQDIIERANKYLSEHDIFIPDYLTDEEKRILIYDIFACYLLKVIIIDYDNKKKKDSENDNITDDFLSTIRLIQYEVGLRYNKRSVELSIINYEGYTKILDNDFETESDKCNLSIECDMRYMKEYQILEYLRNIQIVIPSNSDEKSINSSIIQPKEMSGLILSGYFNKGESLKRHQYYPANNFQDRNDLFTKTHYIFKTYTAEADIIKNIKGHSLRSIIENYQYELLKKVEEQIKTKTITALKPLYENNCTYLEHMINIIVSFDKKFKNLLEEYKKTGDDKIAKKILYDRSYQVFWNYEMPYLAIEQAYPGNIERGMYIILQNFILDLTEILNSHGQEIAIQFKNSLSDKNFKEHTKKILQYSDPVRHSFDSAIEFETVFAEKHKEYAKEPETVEDFFQFIRTGTYSSFRLALYTYYMELKNAQKKKS